MDRRSLWPLLARVLLVATAAGLLLGAFGPYGTYQSMRAPSRYVFWMTCTLAGASIHVPAYLLGQWAGKVHGLSPWVWVTLAALGAALPMTFMVNGIAVSLLADWQVYGPFGLYPFVALVSLPVLAIAFLVGNARFSPVLKPASGSPIGSTPAPGPSESERPAAPLAHSTPLLDAMPPALGKDIICLKMEDHYVRVHTKLGETLLLGRMADFERELDGRIDGLRVHRSWWVARAAVIGWQRADKALNLTLINGLIVPVARDRQSEMKAVGWLEPMVVPAN